jgi:hypothetical protein
LQDNGTRYTGSADPTFYWPLSFNYDGAWCFVPDNGQYFYFSTNGGKIIKIKLDEAGNMTDFVRVDPIGPAEEDYLFINPFMMDPVKNEVLYVPTAHRIWVNYGTDVIPFNNKFDSTALNWGNLPDTIGAAPNLLTVYILAPALIVLRRHQVVGAFIGLIMRCRACLKWSKLPVRPFHKRAT